MPQDSFDLDDIKVFAELDKAVPIQPPPLEPDKHRPWGKVETQAVCVLLGQKVYRHIREHGASEPHTEVGGVILGQVSQHENKTYVQAQEALSAPQTRAGGTHVTFTPDTWSALIKEQERLFPKLQVVGWYHTHPHMRVFYSGQDHEMHKAVFTQPWEFGIVYVPDEHEAGFFFWKGKRIDRADAFYEVFDVEPNSIVRWSNLKHEHDSSDAPKPNPVDPVPVIEDAPKSETPSTEQPIALMEIPSNPPQPPPVNLSRWVWIGLSLAAVVAVGGGLLIIQSLAELRNTQGQQQATSKALAEQVHQQQTRMPQALEQFSAEADANQTASAETNLQMKNLQTQVELLATQDVPTQPEITATPSVTPAPVVTQTQSAVLKQPLEITQAGKTITGPLVLSNTTSITLTVRGVLSATSPDVGQLRLAVRYLDSVQTTRLYELNTSAYSSNEHIFTVEVPIIQPGEYTVCLEQEVDNHRACLAVSNRPNESHEIKVMVR